MSHVKTNKVNETLLLPSATDFEKNLSALLNTEEPIIPLIILIVDVDKFLNVNTEYGYEAGDNVLISAGSYLKEKLPACASLYRVGGDEFAIIFNGEMEKEDVFLWAERIRNENNITLPSGKPLGLTFGISAAFDDGNSYHELVRKADGAMFRGKLNGGNRVCLAREEKMVTKTSHYTTDQLQRLTKLSKREGIGEAILLREALDILFKKYDV